MERRERHDCTLRIKSLDPAGSFTGIAACYDNVDLGGDRILPGAFSRTISASKVFPLLWQHQADNPIGTATVTDSPSGLVITGQLLMDLDEAKRAYLLIKAKVIKGLSIGFETLQESVEDGVRLLKEIRLWECSIVTFPMNESAQISGVKSLSDEDKAQHLTAIREHVKSIDHHQRAIRMHLKSMLDDDDDDDDDTTDGVLDEPSIFEDNDGDDDKSFLIELQKLAEEAAELETK
jgi:hypothetical protein